MSIYRFFKVVGISAVFLLLVYQGIAFYTGNFSKEAITNLYSVHGPFPAKPKESTQNLLKQKFYYLSRGHQTYAFIGEDGNTVIKFFNFSHLDFPLWLRLLPKVGPIKNYQDKKTKSNLHRLERLFRGHQLAEEIDSELFGFQYQHLDTSEGYFPKDLDVFDAIGMHYSIPLDDVVFVIQQKAIIAREELSMLLAKDDVDGVIKRIDQLFDLLANEFRQGLVDKDPNIIDNVGFLDDRAIRIDVGRLVKSTKLEIHSEMSDRIQKKIHRWVNKYHPGHEPIISQHIQKNIAQLNVSFLPD